MAKKYRSEAAKKLNRQRSSALPKRDSKKFRSGSNPHHGGSLGDSGKPPRRK